MILDQASVNASRLYVFREVFDLKPNSEVYQARWIGLSEDDVIKTP
jgi:hypothetical protein